jgi:hypothetical protein
MELREREREWELMEQEQKEAQILRISQKRAAFICYASRT